MSQTIIEVLTQIRGGAALKDAGDMLAQAVLATKSTGKKSSITLKIDIEPDKQDDQIVTFQPSVDVKIPRKPYAKGIFYADDKGRVSKEDPKQLELLSEQQQEREAEAERRRAAGVTDLARVGRGNGTDG